MKSADFFAPERHGDADAQPGLHDFAVNVRSGPPPFVREALRDAVDTLAAYPTPAADLAARVAVAQAHGRTPDEVLLLAGAAEGFELLAAYQPRHAALIAPSFTEPLRVLTAAGVRVTQVVSRAPDWEIDPTHIPDDADLVVFGNPTNPTSVLHPASLVADLRRPGRLIVVDEAFADVTLSRTADGTSVTEPESVAGQADSDVIVLRSITKTFGLAGLRAGYLLAAPDVIARLTRTRRHWAVGTLATLAIEVCLGRRGLEYSRAEAIRVADQREVMCARLRASGIEILGAPTASFVTITVPDGLACKENLRRRGYAVRSCANFTGLGPDYLRLAVRAEDEVAGLVAALVESIAEVEAAPRIEAAREGQ